MADNTWFDEIGALVEATPEDVFTLAQMYEHEPALAVEHPANNTIRSKIRQTLQRLRDADVIEFLEPGVYRKSVVAAKRVVALPTAYRANRPSPVDSAKGTPPRFDTVPLEHRDIRAYVVSASESRVAVLKEYALVKEFELELNSRGHETSHQRIDAYGTSLWTDLFDAHDGILYEAKSSASREHIRMAIGQLFDYRRVVEVKGISLLLPEEPVKDLCDLLRGLSIGCTYQTSSGEVVEIST